MVGKLATLGWQKFPAEAVLRDWVAAVRPAAEAALEDPQMRARWLTCGGTWFVGVDALANDAAGGLGNSGPIRGQAIDFAQGLFGTLPLHPAQVSVIWPGYPKPREGESAAGLRFRRLRDAAHLDGLKAQGPEKARKIDELHGWIMGIPLTDCGPGASPMVVWQGSHEVMRAALLKALDGVAEAAWRGVDLTAVYQAARREIFETCQRVEIYARPGEAYVIHRLLLHGVAPWTGGVGARMVAYFRPELPGGPGVWLRAA